MKKFYTFCALALSILSLTVSSTATPNLEIMYGDKYVSGGVDDLITIKGIVKNVSTSQSVVTMLKVYMEKIENDQAILVCWGDQCLPPIAEKGLTQFTEEVVLLPGENSEELFHCEVDQAGNEGEMIVTFVFYDKSNPNDSAAFTTQVTIGPTGVEITSPESFTITPNPATDYINVSFDGTVDVIKIYYISGIIVNTIDINNDNARIDISTLPQGVYLLNAYNGKGSIYTRRFVISR